MVFIGLGNPGEQYLHTRHNAGFAVINKLAECTGIKLHKQFFKPIEIGKGFYHGKSLFLVKPMTYMNRSGYVIPWLFKKLKINTDQIVVIADHLDLPTGAMRLRKSGSSGGQKGLQSIIDTLGTDNFARLMFGIDRPSNGELIVDYVLSKPRDEEVSVFEHAYEKAADSLLRILNEPIDKVMNDVNRRKTI